MFSSIFLDNFVSKRYNSLAIINYWVFLLVILTYSPSSEKIVLLSCGFSLSLILLSFFVSIIKACFNKAPSITFFILYLTSSSLLVIGFLVFLLPIILRFLLAALLLLLSIVFLFIKWQFSKSLEPKFLPFLKKYLPNILLSLLIINIFFWIIYLEFFIPSIIFIGLTFTTLKEILIDLKLNIERSHFLLNFSRLFLPFPLLQEGFLLIGFGGEFLLNNWLLILQELGLSATPRTYMKFTTQVPVSSKGIFYAKTASPLINNSPDWLKTRPPGLGASRSFSVIPSSSEKLGIFSNFIQDFPKIFSNKYVNGVPELSPETEKLLTELRLFNNKTSTGKDRILPFQEIVALMLLLEHYPEATGVLPANVLFPYTENALVIAPFEMQKYDKFYAILNEFGKYNQPFYFHFQNEWFCGLNKDDYIRIEVEEVITALNSMTDNPNLCVKRPDFNVTGVFISSNDIFVVIDHKIIAIQAKNYAKPGFRNKVTFTFQDVSLLTNLKEQRGLLVTHKPDGLVISKKALSIENILEKCMDKTESKVIRDSLYYKGEVYAENPLLIVPLQEQVAYNLISSKKGLLPKGKRPLIDISSSSPDDIKSLKKNL